MSEQIFQNLMAEMGLADLPQDKQDELMLKMTEVIFKRMFMETMDKLNPREQDDYGSLVERGAAPEEIEVFLRSKIENYDQILDGVVAGFRRDMIEGAKKAQ